jgi:hypothetical protein
MSSKPPDPPDKSGDKGMLDAGDKNGSKQSMLISFRDKVLGSQPTVTKERVDLVAKKLAQVEHIKGNRLLPMLHVQESVMEELSLPYKGCLIVKLLGKSIGYNMMKTRLERVWKLNGGFDLMEVENSFFMVKFDEEEDKNKVINGGPWMIFDHYLAFRQWSPNFNAATATIDKTMAWIRIPSLNLVYYDESLLWAVASMVGTPVKVDMHTLQVARGKFARLCVEIDLTKPVVGKVGINGEWYHVQYEGLHVICTQCGCYGHTLKDCTPKHKSLTAEPESVVVPTTTAPEVAEETLTDKNGNNINVGNGQTEKPGIMMEEIPSKTDILGINGEPDSLHGEWIKVVRKKRVNKVGSRIAGGDMKGTSFQNLKKRINELNAEKYDQMHDNRSGYKPSQINSTNASIKVGNNKQKRTRSDIGTSKIGINNGKPIHVASSSGDNSVKNKSLSGVNKSGDMTTLIWRTPKSVCDEDKGPAVKACNKVDNSQSNSAIVPTLKGDLNGNSSNGIIGEETSQKHEFNSHQREENLLAGASNNKNDDQDSIIRMNDDDQNVGHSHDTQMQLN